RPGGRRHKVNAYECTPTAGGPQLDGWSRGQGAEQLILTDVRHHDAAHSQPVRVLPSPDHSEHAVGVLPVPVHFLGRHATLGEAGVDMPATKRECSDSDLPTVIERNLGSGVEVAVLGINISRVLE